MLWPWPPVTVRARPAARIRGPGTRPAATALATSMLAPPIPPRSRTVVTPASRFRFALSIALSAANPALVSSFDLLLEVRAAVELEMDVDVDQARHQGLAGAVDLASGARSLRSSRMRADPLDPVGPEENALALLHGSPVEHDDVRDVGRLRHHGIMSPGVRAKAPVVGWRSTARRRIDARRRDHALRT